MSLLTDQDIGQLIFDNLKHLSQFPIARHFSPELANAARQVISVRRLPAADGTLRFEASIDFYRGVEGGLELFEKRWNFPMECRSRKEALEALMLALAQEVRLYLWAGGGLRSD